MLTKVLEKYTTGFYMAKFKEICYQVCFSSSIVEYEHSQNPELKCWKMRKSQYFGNDTSDHQNNKTIKDGGIYKKNSSQILKFWTMLLLNYWTAKTDPVANFVELGHVETCIEYVL